MGKSLRGCGRRVFDRLNFGREDCHLIEKIVPLEDGVDAHHHIARGHKRGKVVIQTD